MPIPPLHVLHARFLLILPRVELHGRIYFRHKNSDRREDLIAEMVGLCWRWFLRLVQRGKDPTRFVSALATYAARAVNSGRRVCGMGRSKDVLNPSTQRRKGFTVSKLPDFSTLSDNPLQEALQDNTRSPVDEQVFFRIDFPAWLLTWDLRRRRLITDMAKGEGTLDLAAKYKVCPARISQMRREFHTNWERFTADPSAC
jgi:hypothetical protein